MSSGRGLCRHGLHGLHLLYRQIVVIHLQERSVSHSNVMQLVSCSRSHLHLCSLLPGYLVVLRSETTFVASIFVPPIGPLLWAPPVAIVLGSPTTSTVVPLTLFAASAIATCECGGQCICIFTTEGLEQPLP